MSPLEGTGAKASMTRSRTDSPCWRARATSTCVARVAVRAEHGGVDGDDCQRRAIAARHDGEYLGMPCT